MAHTVPTQRSAGYVVTAADWNVFVDNWTNQTTSGGLVKHEVGGIEADISAIADGGIVRGTGAGAMGVLASFLTSGGIVRHEYGGIEANISAIADGGILVGTGAGAMAIRASALTAGAAGFLKHEVGGLEFDASAVTTGGLIKGSSAGVMALLARGSATESLRVNSGGTDVAWEPTIVSGTYTGNGGTTQAISGVGVAPKAVIVFQGANSDSASGIAVFTTDKLVDNNAEGVVLRLSDATAYTDVIRSLDSDGFTVGDATPGGPNMNVNSAPYEYLAMG